ncbi:MAG TPA: PASTA domain-containing protein, partial [Acidimicrobiales bacterium]|nr:PASTA domain-containing protein [Acidimicrobiales bacterium]
GRAPFLGDTPVAVASKHVRDIPPVPREINASIPPTFEAIILKSMAKDPDHRYATAEELRADLLRFNEGRSVLAMNDPTAMQAALGATQVVGAVGGADVTQAISAQSRVGAGGPGDNGIAETGRDRNRTRTYVIVLVILLVILAIVGVLLARQLGYLGGASSFNLPNVVGKTQAQATSTLRGDGLTVSSNTQATTQYAPGTVLKTDPNAGTLVKNGNNVTLTVAAAPAVAKTTVPAGITNTDVNTAEGILTQAGLQFTVKNTPNNANQGTVLSADPASGTSINKGATVTLTVSSGPNAVTVPSVAGLSQSAAGNVLGNRGLSVTGTTQQSSTQYGAGLVIGSEPGAGASVNPGSGVTLIVSTGSPPPTSTSTTTSPTTTTTTTSTTTTTTTTIPGLVRKPH